MHYESALVDLDYRTPNKVICVSSAIGCTIGCKFCKTGQKYHRNLNNREIIEQIENIIQHDRLKSASSSKMFEISFMAMGEPLLNYNNLIKTFDWLGKEYGDNLEVTVSTAGLVNKIYELAELNYPFSIDLQISLHSTDQYLRNKLMPGLRDNIKDIINASEYYARKVKRKVCINYLLLNNVNDSEKELRALHKLLNPKYHYVKLSEINSNSSHFSKPPDSKYKIFYNFLLSKNIETKLFKSKGVDIGAGCGQLSAAEDIRLTSLNYNRTNSKKINTVF